MSLQEQSQYDETLTRDMMGINESNLIELKVFTPDSSKPDNVADQVEHYNSISEKLNTVYVDKYGKEFQMKYYIDGSTQGTGKTYNAYRRYQQMFIENKIKRIFVVGAASSAYPWKAMFNETAGTDYEILSSKHKGRGPNELLTRRIVGDEKIIVTSLFISYDMLTAHKEKGGYNNPLFVDGTNFVPSNILEYISKEGVLLIVDEAHGIKNESKRTNAVRSLIKSVVNGNDNSRIGFLSSTLFNEEKNALSFLESVGIIEDTSTYFDNIDISDEEGPLAKLLDFSSSIDAEKTTEIYESTMINKGGESSRGSANAKKFYYNLFRYVIGPAIYDAILVDIPSYSYNGFFNISRYSDIREIDNVAEESGRREGKQNGESILLYRRIEMSLVRDMCSLASLYLDEVPNSKVILSFNWESPYTLATEIMSEHLDVPSGTRERDSPVRTFTGQTESSHKENNIKDFQADNNNVRVLIVHLKSGNQSISLHDIGEDEDVMRPRFMIISPYTNGSSIDVTQLVGRVARLTQRSISTIIIFRALNAAINRNEIENFYRKLLNIKHIQEMGESNGEMELASSYDIYLEDIFEDEDEDGIRDGYIRAEDIELNNLIEQINDGSIVYNEKLVRRLMSN